MPLRKEDMTSAAGAFGEVCLSRLGLRVHAVQASAILLLQDISRALNC